MKIRGIGRLRRIARRVTNMFVPRALILLYHRVTELPSDPQLLCVSRRHFAEHLEILRKEGCPIRLQRSGRSLRDENLPHRGVVVTFDDGYADNLCNAKPLLERYDVPATVFVTTGYMGQEREFWWDELDRLLLQRETLPETLRLNVNGSTCQWELSASAHFNEGAYRRHRYWNVSEKDDPSPRHSLYRSLHRMLRPMAEREQRKVLDELREWAGAGSTLRPTHRVLSPDEVIRLGEGGLVEVGSHTVTHPVLSTLPGAAQRAEIRQSKAHLEEILGRPVTSFAYPYGSASDYTEETVAAIRQAGYLRGCSNFAGVIGPVSDRFQLPRFLVRDWDGDSFARQLGAWFCA